MHTINEGCTHFMHANLLLYGSLFIPRKIVPLLLQRLSLLERGRHLKVLIANTYFLVAYTCFVFRCARFLVAHTHLLRLDGLLSLSRAPTLRARLPETPLLAGHASRPLCHTHMIAHTRTHTLALPSKHRTQSTPRPPLPKAT